MRAEIKNLQQRLRATAVYVTHDQIEAMTMADKIVVLRDGAVEQIGSPLEVYDRPANAFVAGFIGSPAMNMLRGRVEGGERLRFLTGDGLVVTLPSAPRAALGREVTLGVRPEHLTVGGPNAFAATVEIVEPTGAETVLNVNWGSASLVCVLHERVAARPGETLPLGFDGAPLHFFDAATGVALTD